jgi:hypothetical protein
VIDEKIVKFVDLQLRLIKCVDKKLFENLNVIIVSDFYQVQPIHDVGIFKINTNNINSLAPNFWMETIKC